MTCSLNIIIFELSIALVRCSAVMTSPERGWRRSSAVKASSNCVLLACCKWRSTRDCCGNDLRRFSASSSKCKCTLTCHRLSSRSFIFKLAVISSFSISSCYHELAFFHHIVLNVYQLLKVSVGLSRPPITSFPRPRLNDCC